MRHSPSWETDNLSASHEIPRILWNTNVHYHIQYSPYPLPILIQISPLHDSISASWRYTLLISANINLGLPSGLFPSVFLTKILYAAIVRMRAIYPAHLNLLHLITRIIFGEHCRSLSCTQCSLLFQRRDVTAFPSPLSGGPSLVGFSWGLFKTFPATLHICRTFLHPQPEDAPR
jgi:hypothetical protein